MPIIIAAGPVIVQNNKVLLVRHGDDFWKFCGGKVDDIKKENLIEAATREAKEELGIDISIIDKSPFLFYANKLSQGENIDIILVHYLAGYSGQIIHGGDIDDWVWLNLADLAQENLAPNIISALKHFNLI